MGPGTCLNENNYGECESGRKKFKFDVASWNLAEQLISGVGEKY